VDRASNALPDLGPLAAGEVARVRALVVATLDEARARAWPFLSDLLEGALRPVSDDDRGLAVRLVHELVRYDRLLAFATAGRRTDGEARLDALLAIADPASPERASLQRRLDRIEPATERLGVRFSLPDWLVDVIRDDVGEAALAATLARMNGVPPRVARVNTLRTTRDACLRALADSGIPARPTAHAPLGLVLDGRRSPFRTAAFARGDFEMQDEASQLVAELVAPPPRTSIVDACAGAGGKSLALAAALGGKGRVYALDVSEAKLGELRRRARRAGASNVQGERCDLLAPNDAFHALEGRAARVLVDAPCTGLGAIRRNPELRWRLRPEHVDALTETQGALLRAAASLVMPRGRIVYATCSFLRREGERVFERFLADDPRFARVTARDILGRARSNAVATHDGLYLRTWRAGPGVPVEGDAPPDADAMDGFFAAVARLTVDPPAV
jgi:16S rRNA (cytosine967-C5)-methyltransferase